ATNFHTAEIPNAEIPTAEIPCTQVTAPQMCATAGALGASDGRCPLGKDVRAGKSGARVSECRDWTRTAARRRGAAAEIPAAAKRHAVSRCAAEASHLTAAEATAGKTTHSSGAKSPAAEAAYGWTAEMACAA
ncbi:MAG TPA: hypothetical protein VGX76_01270, partial [Pirellulales bacterium]|nr:hypothetical protein [Pirellulales bacterium]